MDAPHRLKLVTAPSFAALETAVLDGLVERSDGSAPRPIGLVPTPYAAHRMHRLLDDRGAAGRYPVLLTVREFTRRLAGADLSPPLPGAALAVLRALLHEPTLAGPLHDLAARPGGQGAMLSTFDALRDAGYVRPGMFRDAVAALPAPSTLLVHLAALYERFEQEIGALSGTGSVRMRAALERAEGVRERFRTDRLIIHGIVAFTPYERTLIEAVAHTMHLTVYLPYAADGTGSAAARPWTAVEPVRDWLLSLGCEEIHLPDDPAISDLDHLRRFWPAARPPADRPESAAPPQHPPPSVTVISAPNAVREVREVARAIVRAADEGMPYDEMAVLYHVPDVYAPLLADTLTRLNVPVFLESGRPLVTLPAGRALRQLLLLIHGSAQRAAVMEFITSAPVRLLAGAVPARWDRLARAAGIIRGSDQWQTRLRHLIADRTAEAQREDERTEGATRERLIDDAAEAGRLREYVGQLFSRLAAVPDVASWPEFVAALRSLAEELLDDPDLTEILAEFDGLAGLSAVEPQTSFEAFREAALARLNEQRVRPNPPTPFPARQEEEPSTVVELAPPPLRGTGAPERLRRGVGVFLSDTGAAQALRFRRIWVLGVTDGSFPARPERDPLLPDLDRARLGVETSVERAARAPALFKLLLGAASEHLTLSFPRAEPGGARPYQPSYFLLKVGETLLGRRLRFDELDQIPGFRRISSARFAPDNPADAIDETERNLSRIELGEGFAELADAELFERWAALVERRRSRRFIALDGVFLDPGALNRVAERADPTRRPLAPTAIETYATCPQRYFLQRLLGLAREDEPDALERLAARDKGGLMHQVLEAFYRELRDAGELPLRPERLDAYRARLLAALAARCREEERRGRTGHALLWDVDQAEMADDLLESLDEDLKRAADGFVPSEFERPFGMMGEPAPELILAGGRTLRFRGLIDRIDRHADGRLRVIDYKTGRAGFTTPNRLRGGRQMQAPVYLLAAQQAYRLDASMIEAELYYCSRRGNFRHAPFSGSALNERADDVTRIVAMAADGISAGRFFPHPFTRGEHHCRACDFRLVCDARVDRLWTQKQDDPAAAGFIAITEIE